MLVPAFGSGHCGIAWGRPEFPWHQVSLVVCYCQYNEVARCRWRSRFHQMNRMQVTNGKVLPRHRFDLSSLFSPVHRHSEGELQGQLCSCADTDIVTHVGECVWCYTCDLIVDELYNNTTLVQCNKGARGSIAQAKADIDVHREHHRATNLWGWQDIMSQTIQRRSQIRCERPPSITMSCQSILTMRSRIGAARLSSGFNATVLPLSTAL